MDRLRRMRDRLSEHHGDSPHAERLFRAPGRVNLIGEHTDYNDGWVMPLAIGFDTWVLARPRNDGWLVADTLDLGETHRWSTAAAATRPAGDGHWSSYVEGVAIALRAAGFVLPGANLVIDSTVPIGSGLSSSAALEVAVAMALVQVSGQAAPSSVDLARICQRAENETVGARCGIMDQYASVHGVAGQALQLDCRALRHRAISIGPAGALKIVICNTLVKHSVAAGEYNCRRQECEAAVAAMAAVDSGIHALRDVASLAQLETHRHRMDDVVYRRARHIVTENVRVQLLADALQAGALHDIGAIMAASHVSMRDDFEISCQELDALVESASRQRGLVGSRMTGGGFGGCTVNLVAASDVETFSEGICVDYERQFGRAPEIYVCEAAAGAGECHVS
jgi:galactokinase